MKTHILAGIVIAGALATSAAQAAMSPSTESAEALYSGLSAAEIQQIHKASEQRMDAHKATCNWHQGAEVVADQLYAPYPGNDSNFGEKDYLAAANTNFMC